MPALSKTSIPSDMIISINFSSQLPMLESNVRYLDYLHNLNVVSSPVQRSGLSCAESEFSKWIEMAYILVVLIVQNMLCVLDSQKPATSNQLSLQASPEMIFAKYPGPSRKSRDLRKIFDTFFQQMPTETRRFSKYIEDLRVSIEILAILDQLNLQMSSKTRFLKNTERVKLPQARVWVTASYNRRSQVTDTYLLRDEMKRLEMCCLCQEKITEKKFFGERRYGILSNCDCMICYGCFRKTTRKAGWVKDSVICPVCSVESDTFASRHKWIEGQEKLDFFQTYIKNTETIAEAIKARPDMIEGMYSEPEDEQLSNFTKYLAHIFI